MLTCSLRYWQQDPKLERSISKPYVWNNLPSHSMFVSLHFLFCRPLCSFFVSFKFISSKFSRLLFTFDFCQIFASNFALWRERQNTKLLLIYFSFFCRASGDRHTKNWLNLKISFSPGSILVAKQFNFQKFGNPLAQHLLYLKTLAESDQPR